MASLGSDRRVALWDAHSGSLAGSMQTRDHEDLVALESDERSSLFAVGGCAHVSFFDARASSALHNERLAGLEVGVRSMCFKNNMLVVGGGMGRISFFDLVAGKFMRFKERPFLSLDTRGRDSSDFAVYTVRYDDSGSRLFVAGGPLLLHASGAHASIW